MLHKYVTGTNYMSLFLTERIVECQTDIITNGSYNIRERKTTQ